MERVQMLAEKIVGRLGTVGRESFVSVVLIPLMDTYGKDFSGDTMGLWYNMLKLFDEGTLRDGLVRAMSKRKSMPTPANIADACRAVRAERIAGSHGNCDGKRVAYVCRDGAAIRIWKGLEGRCNRDFWNNWLRSCAPHKVEDGVLLVFVPSAFLRDRLNNNEGLRLRRLLPQGAGLRFELFTGGDGNGWR